MVKEQAQVQSKAFLTRPMKDTIIDYTWRTQGSDILICPSCGKHGTPRRYGSQSVILHTELASDIRYNQLLDYCPADTEEIQLILARKEQANLLRQRREERRHQDVEARRRLKAKKGQSIVELSLLIPFLCLLLFGTLDIARYIRLHVELSHAANVGLSVAQQSYTCPNLAGCTADQQTPVTNADVVAAIQGVDPKATVVAPLSNPTPNATYDITVTADYGPITPFAKTLLGRTPITAESSGTTLP